MIEDKISQHGPRGGNLSRHSVVDVDLGVEVPGEELLSLEPQGELAVGGLDGVRAVDDVAGVVKRRKEHNKQTNKQTHG